MLIAALVLFLTHSGNDLLNQNLVDQVGSYVNKSIEDTSRQETLQAIVEALEKEQAEVGLEAGRTLQSLAQLDQDVACKREQFEAMLNEYNRHQQDSYRTMLDLRFKLKDNMTRAEWEEIFAKP